MLQRLFQRRKPQARPLFAIGSLHLSEKVHWLSSKDLIDPLPYVQRHVRGDWGDIDEAGYQANTAALEQFKPMRSVYRITPRLELIVITAEGHASTVIQLPEEKSLI